MFKSTTCINHATKVVAKSNNLSISGRDAKKHVFFKPCFLCKKKVFFIEKNSFLMFFFVFFNYRKIFN